MLKWNFLLVYFLFLNCIFLISCATKTTENQTPMFCKALERNPAISLGKELQLVEYEMKEKTGVFVLENGGAAMISRAWLCDYAEQTIDIQYFIFSTDNIGLIASDYLVRAANRGVKIRMIVDDIMVDAAIGDILTIDAHENISIKIYNPALNVGKNIFEKIGTLVTDFRDANLRMHNKTFIVDNQVVITGGRNIADEYFDFNRDYNFRDRDVLLLGKSVQDVNTSFEQFWTSEFSVPITELVEEDQLKAVQDTTAIAASFERLHEYACNPDNFWPAIRNRISTFHQTIELMKKSDEFYWVDNVEFVSDEPGKNDGSQGLGGGGISTTRLIELVKNAKKTIDIQSPYLVTSELSRGLFRAAVNRGVKVRILTNSLSSTDNLEAFSGYQKDREALLETGARIFEFKPDAAIRKQVMTDELQGKIDYTPVFGLHSKSMVIDGEITVIGTFNLDPRSANLNTECITVIHSKEVTAEVAAGIEKEFLPENAWETTLEFNPDKLVPRMKRLKTWTRKIVPKSIL